MSSPESPRAPAPTPLACLLTLALLALLLTGCAARLPAPASSSVPPLPAEAMPSQCLRPTVCQPSCSKGVSTLLDSLTASLQAEKPARPATGP